MISMAFSVARMPLLLAITHKSFPADSRALPKSRPSLDMAAAAVSPIPVFKKFLRENLAMI
jgi:hypothetical protein